jgi:hypothetical protein
MAVATTFLCCPVVVVLLCVRAAPLFFVLVGPAMRAAPGIPIPIAGVVCSLVFVSCAILLPRAVAPLRPAVSLAAFEDRRDATQLPAPDIRGAGVELAPFLLLAFGQVVEPCLGLGGFFR